MVGPTRKIQDYNVDYFYTARQQEYKIITWSGGINLFRDIGFAPDYYSFLDPLSMMWYDEISVFKNSVINENTSLILADIYDNIFTDEDKSEYYKLGYTCDKAKKKSSFLKKEFEEQIKNNNFKKTIKIKPNNIPIDSVNSFIDFKKSFHILTDFGNDTDKLTSFLIPIVLYYFKNITEIKCLGFGDINRNKTIGRYMDKKYGRSSWVSKQQDLRFLKNYKKNIPIIDKFFKKYSINFNFEYENEYSRFRSYPVEPLGVVK